MFNFFRGSQLNFIVLQQAQQRYHGDFNQDTPQFATWWRYYRAGALSTTPASPVIYVASNLVTKSVTRQVLAKAGIDLKPLPAHIATNSNNNKNEEREFQKRALAVSAISGLSAAVTHPIAVINTWQITQDIPRSIPETYRSIKFNNKSLSDGLLLDVSLVAGSEYLNAVISRQLMSLVKSKWPQTTNPTASAVGLDKTSGLINSFLIQASVSSVSFMLVRALLYPLYTARYHLEAQGSSVFNPSRYNSTLEVFQSIWKEEGLQGFYKGFTSLGFALTFDQVSLVLANLVIGFLLHKCPEDALQKIDEALVLFQADKERVEAKESFPATA